MSTRGRFDAAGFFSALDAERRSLSLNWKQVASEAKVSASTLTRMGQGRRPDVDSLAALAVWSGIDPAAFIQRERADKVPGPLAMISTYLRSDPHLADADARALMDIIEVTYERFRKPDGPETRIQDRGK